MKFHLHFSGFWEDETKMASITERLTNLLGEPSASRAREEELYVLLYDEARKTIRKGYWYDEEPDWVEQDHGDGFWAEAVEQYING